MRYTHTRECTNTHNTHTDTHTHEGGREREGGERGERDILVDHRKLARLKRNKEKENTTPGRKPLAKATMSW